MTRSPGGWGTSTGHGSAPRASVGTATRDGVELARRSLTPSRGPEVPRRPLAVAGLQAAGKGTPSGGHSVAGQVSDDLLEDWTGWFLPGASLTASAVVMRSERGPHVPSHHRHHGTCSHSGPYITGRDPSLS